MKEDFLKRAKAFFCSGGDNFYVDFAAFLRGQNIVMKSGFRWFFVWNGRCWKPMEKEVMEKLLELAVEYYFPDKEIKEMSLSLYSELEDCPGSIKKERIIVSYSDKAVEYDYKTENFALFEWDMNMPIYYESELRFGNVNAKRPWFEITKEWADAEGKKKLADFLITALTPAWKTQYEKPRWIKMNLDDEKVSAFANWLCKAFPTVVNTRKMDGLNIEEFGSYFADYPELPRNYLGDDSIALLVHEKENPDFHPWFPTKNVNEAELCVGPFLSLLKII